MKIFISWSGDYSKAIAAALDEWLPEIFDGVETFMSDQKIALGDRGLDEIKDSLDKSAYGIILVTKDNENAKWINFEAGALSRAIPDAKARVIPILVDFENTNDLVGPLTQFQGALMNRKGLLKMAQSIGEGFGFTEDKVQRKFDKWWPDLEEALAKIEKPEPAEDSSSRRSMPDMLDEILGHIREMRREESAARHPSRTQIVRPESTGVPSKIQLEELSIKAAEVSSELGIEIVGVRRYGSRGADFVIFFPDDVPDQERGRFLFELTERMDYDVQILARSERQLLRGDTGESVGKRAARLAQFGDPSTS